MTKKRTQEEMLNEIRAASFQRASPLIVPAPLIRHAPKRNPLDVSNSAVVAWDRYLVKSELGSILRQATIERFTQDLNRYLALMQGRLIMFESEDWMEAVDFNKIILDHRKKDGTVDQKAAVDWFKGALAEAITTIEAEEEFNRNFERNMVAAIHQTFDKAGKDILPKRMLIEYALRELQVPMNQYQEGLTKIEDYLGSEKQNETKAFGTKVGVNGGVVRVKDRKGSLTKAFKDDEANIKFGRVTRKGKGDDEGDT